MTDEEKLGVCEAKLAQLHDQQKKIEKELRRESKKRDKLLLQINSENLKNPGWLLKNPTMPGAHEATEKLIKDSYGGVFDGPHPTGYLYNGDHTPIQKNFDFSLNTYGDDSKKEMLKKNCDHFIENFLPLLSPVMKIESRWNDKFPEVNVVPFKFRSESSGLDFLGYDPKGDRWYHYTIVYSSVDTKRDFANFEEAFEFAYALANTEEDNY